MVSVQQSVEVIDGFVVSVEVPVSVEEPVSVEDSVSVEVVEVLSLVVVGDDKLVLVTSVVVGTSVVQLKLLMDPVSTVSDAALEVRLRLLPAPPLAPESGLFGTEPPLFTIASLTERIISWKPVRICWVAKE